MPDIDKPQQDNFEELRRRLPELKTRISEYTAKSTIPDSRLGHVAHSLYLIADGQSDPMVIDGTHEEYEKARGTIETLDLYLQILEQHPEILKEESETKHSLDVKLPPLPQYVRDLAIRVGFQ